MLFWSFILAFVVGILYYVSLPYDAVQIEQKPMADTAVVMFVNAHQRAKEMIYTIENAGSRTVEITQTDANGNPVKGGGYKDVTDVTAPTIIMMYDDWMRGVIQQSEDATGEIGIFHEKSAVLDSSTNEIPFGVMDNTYRNSSLTVLSSDRTKEDLMSIVSLVARIGTITYEKTEKNALTNEEETSVEKGPSKKMIFDCVDYDDGGNTGCACEYKKQCIDGKDCSDDAHCARVSETDKTCDYRSVCRLKGNLMDATTDRCVCTTKDYVITYMNPELASWAGNEKITHQELWRSAILRRTKGSHECGVLYPTVGLQRNGVKVLPKIAKKYDTNAEYVLDNSQRFTVSIPKVITDEIKKYTGETDLTDYLFCITPIDDIQTELSGVSDGKKGGVFHRKGYIIKESKED